MAPKASVVKKAKKGEKSSAMEAMKAMKAMKAASPMKSMKVMKSRAEALGKTAKAAALRKADEWPDAIDGVTEAERRWVERRLSKEKKVK